MNLFHYTLSIIHLKGSLICLDMTTKKELDLDHNPATGGLCNHFRPSVCLVTGQLKNKSTDFDEIWQHDRKWHWEEPIKFWASSESEIRKKCFQLQGHNLLVMWPLDDTSGPLRSFGSNRTKIRRLTSVSCEKCRGTERRIAPAVYNFNSTLCGVCAPWVPF